MHTASEIPEFMEFEYVAPWLPSRELFPSKVLTTVQVTGANQGLEDNIK
jgi:hypothetical protein